MADSMLISGLSHSRGHRHGTCVSARSASRSLPSANARMPSASQYEANTGMPSRTCSAAAPFMTAPARVSSCQVPWPARDHERVAAEPHHRRLKRRQRPQRRIEEQQSENLACERLRLGPLAQALREREQIDDSARAQKSARSRRSIHADHEIRSSASPQRSTCSSSRMNGGSRRRTCGSRARAGEDVRFEQLPSAHPWRAWSSSQAEQETRALDARRRARRCRSSRICADTRARWRAGPPDSMASMTVSSDGAGHRSAAERRAERIDLECGAISASSAAPTPGSHCRAPWRW